MLLFTINFKTSKLKLDYFHCEIGLRIRRTQSEKPLNPEHIAI